MFQTTSLRTIFLVIVNLIFLLKIFFEIEKNLNNEFLLYNSIHKAELYFSNMLKMFLHTVLVSTRTVVFTGFFYCKCVFGTLKILR